MDTWRYIKCSKRHNSISSANVISKKSKPTMKTTHTESGRARTRDFNKEQVQCSVELFFSSFRQSPIHELSWVFFSLHFICAITKASDHSIVSWESAPKNKATFIVLSISKDEIESIEASMCWAQGMFYFLMQFIWYQQTNTVHITQVCDLFRSLSLYHLAVRLRNCNRASYL